MRNFSRALKLALTHRVNVATCIFTSAVIAVLWGGNLTAVFPVVEVIMNDHALPDWIDQKIAESQQEVNDANSWLAQLEKLKADNPAEIRQRIQSEIDRRKSELLKLKEKAARTLDDVLIAEKTRIDNDIKHLEWLEKTPPDHLAAKLSQELGDTQHHVHIYTKRADHFRWIAPIAHRWLPTTPFGTLLVVCLFVVLCTVVKGLFRIWNGIVVSRLGCQIGYDLRMQFYSKVLRLDMANFTEAGRGDIMNRCTTDLNSITQGVQRLFGQALLEPLEVIVCLGIAAYVSWQLLLLTLFIAPVAGYSIHWLGKALKRTHRKAMQELSMIYETLSETLGGIKLIKAFTMEPAEKKKFEKSAKEYYNRQMRIAVYNALVSPFVETLGIAMVLLASVMGGYLVLGQHTHILGIKISDIALTHGDMSIFFAMLAGMSDPARRLSGEFSNIQQAIAAADRVYQVLDREQKVVDAANPVALPSLRRSLKFENVSFQYNAEKPVLRNVNLEVRAGETIAIVGANGCGKTTLVQLLPRFYDPYDGRVTIDGTDIRDVPLQELRTRFGLVSQEILMFNDTVENNIRYGNPNATMAEIEAAARAAHAHSFITEKLPDGYQSLVGPGGSRLSGGQRQRISLARAILRDPEILLLDEATSQIDIESEQLIFDVLEKFARDRTTFMITHRTSMISLADRVVVMDQGQIIDTGSHNELVGRCDLYRRLCHFGYRESA
ncbi:MAG TPA: ABC transporter ATP-binding protein [Lacipirellulaceae bacterium]|nr:ABC transporter ATP-binding protein [Lacipirellulaceae bacterium]